MNYFVDYLGFYLGGIGNRIKVKNRSERLKFDILCINPQNDKLIFSLPETLLEDSNRILIEYEDFWKNNIFKIALDKKYRNANAYINDRVKVLEKNFPGNENYELDIYQSGIANSFINDYLVGNLKLRGQNSFIVHRTSNADMKHRDLLKERINNNNLIYKELSSYLNTKEIDKIVNYFNDQADNRKILFQRGLILGEVFNMYPSLNSNHSFLYHVFDNNYNDALALSVDAERLSNLVDTLNGVSLSKFMYNFDPCVYKKICAYNAHQVYLLSINPSWIIFVEKIRELYKHLFWAKNIDQNYNVYKYYRQKVIIKKYPYDFIVRIMDLIIGQTGIPQPYWFFDYNNLKRALNDYINNFLELKDYMFCVSSDIFERKKAIQTIVNDIGQIV